MSRSITDEEFSEKGFGEIRSGSTAATSIRLQDTDTPINWAPQIRSSGPFQLERDLILRENENPKSKLRQNRSQEASEKLLNRDPRTRQSRVEWMDAGQMLEEGMMEAHSHKRVGHTTCDRRRKSSIEREASIVNAQLEVLRKREAEFQRILDDMQRLKDSVALEKQVLEAKSKELHSERQPINWLPVELLMHIFVTFTAAGLDSHQPDEVYHRAPVIVSHVSSRWRSISLATPKMWTRLSVQSTVWNARPIVTFLARSGTAPLDLVFISPQGINPQEEHRRADRLLNHLSHDIPRYERLRFNLAAASLNVSIVSLTSSSLVPVQFQGTGASLKLSYLRLEKLPLFNIPTHFLPNLTILELCFPPKRVSLEGPSSYVLRMSQLVRFLNCTPNLEELVLSNTVPYMDVCLNRENAVSDPGDRVEVEPVDLAHLRSIEWTYPYSTDIHHFLSFLAIPTLEKLELGVEEIPALRTNVFLLRGYHDTAAPHLFASQCVMALGALHDLSLHCTHEDTLGAVLRKFALPALAKLELTHIGAARAPLPRLESVFRDPRLPALTHLTLCHFAVPPELGRAEALLGYMPALVALTLDACAGAAQLLGGLQQRVAGAGAVRVCPRLEALALWRCADVGIAPLAAVAVARNGNVVALGGEVRVIRPMRRTRRQGEASLNILSSMIAVEEAARPARIGYVRVEACALISEEQAMSLKALGVPDVVWSSE
ncbi:hypothetical protein B0H10DRAFT_1939795 [Mycena sp. CBHHK59/15]|nr:hypothetical protein B0H10DRAFT_1939795 [Mycena sp. CBHHK59/15]